jgi:hypothetical protein
MALNDGEAGSRLGADPNAAAVEPRIDVRGFPEIAGRSGRLCRGAGRIRVWAGGARRSTWIVSEDQLCSACRSLSRRRERRL